MYARYLAIPGFERLKLSMTEFAIFDTPISDLKVIERSIVSDSRGFLARIFCAKELQSLGWKRPVAQINLTVTKNRGVVRGMHFQNPPHSEMKLVTCTQGKIWDVVIDLRKNSPTFLRWHGEILSSENFRSLLIPEGFAHGFQALVDNCELFYLHSSDYAPDFEAGIHPKDPYIGISWPLDLHEISARDNGHPFLDNQFNGISL